MSTDRFTLDVLREGFAAIADEMFLSLQRTSQSPIIYEVLDFGVGVANARGELVSQGNGIAGFLGPLGDAITETIARVPDLRPGDVIAANDPYAGGGTHLSDVAQARILELIARLRDERRLSYLLITHNLAVVSELCEQTAVLYLGRVAESGPTAELLGAPAHPYTRALRSAVPEVDASARSARIVLSGEPASAVSPPPGCVFHPRCPLAIDRCATEVPALRVIAPGRRVACHRAEEVLAGAAMSSAPQIASPSEG